jgi:hypothetical protein
MPLTKTTMAARAYAKGRTMKSMFYLRGVMEMPLLEGIMS